MASSPPQESTTNAGSPPYPSHTNLPTAHPPNLSHKRRPSENPSIRNRKASMISITSNTSAHPLRQTSFPPESALFTPGYERSPSMDTMSVSGSAVGPMKRKRARKSKAGKGGGDDESAVGSSKQDGGPSAKKQRISTAGSGDEEEDDRGDQTITAMVSGTKEEKQREMERRAVLVKHLDEQQFRRYEAVRSAKLADATVRRIVNQTLSQSVPATVILAIRSVAKQFIGEMVEGARKVQTQWIETGEPNSGLPSPPAEVVEDADMVEEEQEREVKKELRRAPLQAEHLREALRRSRAAAEGGMAGQLNLWQLQQHNGTERFGSKVRGKRLFK